MSSLLVELKKDPMHKLRKSAIRAAGANIALYVVNRKKSGFYVQMQSSGAIALDQFLLAPALMGLEGAAAPSLQGKMYEAQLLLLDTVSIYAVSHLLKKEKINIMDSLILSVGASVADFGDNQLMVAYQ